MRSKAPKIMPVRPLWSWNSWPPEDSVRRPFQRSGCQLREGRVARQLLALAGSPAFQLHDPVLQPARSDGQMPGQTDQVHVRELGARPFVAVVVKHFDTGG